MCFVSEFFQSERKLLSLFSIFLAVASRDMTNQVTLLLCFHVIESLMILNGSTLVTFENTGLYSSQQRQDL